MKFFTVPALLAAVLLAFLTAVPFSNVARRNSDLFVVEVRMQTAAPGRLQAYFDDGRGFNEFATAQVTLRPGPATESYRLPIPAGTYTALRLDPNDRDAPCVLESVRVLSRGGRVLRSLALGELQPNELIAAARERNGQLEVTPRAGTNDPQLLVTLTPPLVVASTWHEVLLASVPLFAGVLGVLALGLWSLDRLGGLRSRLVAAGTWLGERPRVAVASVALLAVAASSYPVIFMGRSFVSPSSGAELLYDTYPTLPGYTEAERVDIQGSDVGAIMWQHVGYAAAQRNALLQGEWPLWNRFAASGAPLLGQGQAMFGDPLHLPVVLSGSAAWAWDLKYLVAKWLFAAGLGVAVLLVARHLGAALMVTLAAPFIGFFVVRINHPAFFSLCYAPWILVAWLRITGAATWRGAAWGAAGLMLANWCEMHSGTAKEAYMLLLGLNAAGGVTLLTVRPWRAQLVRWAIAAWAGLLFVLIALPWWGVFLHTLGNAYTSYNAVSAFQIQPSLLLGLFDEVFYRHLTPLAWVFNPSLNLLFLLGVLYFVATLRVQAENRLALALAWAAVPALALVYGLVPPAWIVRVPFLGNVAHIDNCFSCVLIVLFAVLAGVGFATAARRLRTAEGRGDLLVAGLLLAMIVAAWIGFRQAAHRSIYGAVGATYAPLQPGQVLPVPEFVWGSLVALLLAALVLAWVMRRALSRGRFTPALVLLATAAIAVMLWRHGLQPRGSGFEEYVVRPGVRADFHALSPAVERLREATRVEPSRGLGLRGNFFAGWVGMYGLEGVYAADGLTSPFYRELTSKFPGVDRAWDWRMFVDPANVAKARPYLDALNVRHYLERMSDTAVLGKSLRLVQTGDLDVYESPTAWPRAFFTDRLLVYDQVEQFVAAVGSAEGKPLAAIQRADHTAYPALGVVWSELASRRVSPATRYELTANTTSFTVRAEGAGVVVLSENYWPGDFRAEVDGVKARVVRLNHAFKGVLIETPGEHRVTFRYVPKHFPWLLGLAGLGLVLLAGSLAVVGRERLS